MSSSGPRALSPGEQSRLMGEAFAALQRRDGAAARAACEAVLADDATVFGAWRLLGMAAGLQGDADCALQAATRAQALRPRDAAVALELGTHLLRAGRAGEAMAPLRLAMDAPEPDMLAGFRYGLAAFQLGDYEAAAAGFERAAEREPSSDEAWNNLAAALGRLQRYPQAIAAARNALRLTPQDAQAHQTLAALLSNLFERDALEEALRAAERALQLDPSLAAAHRDAAVVLRKLGDLVPAQAHAQRAVQLAPGDATGIEILGDLLVVNRRSSDAVAVYRAAFAHGVDTPALRRQHGIALLRDGQAAAAHQALDALLREQPQDQRAIAHLGVAMAADGQLNAAIERLGLQRHIQSLELPLPVGFDDGAAFHRALADDIRRHSQQRWEPAGLAARGAYLSGDLLADRTPAILGFEQRLREAIAAYIAACRAAPSDDFLRSAPERYRLHVWATQAAESGYIDTHIHEESWLSGAYYVELPPAIADDDAEHAGWIEFGRPYAGLPAWPEHALRQVRPRVGELLLFPSYLFHRTLPYRGGGERISISFDLAAV
ncbi:MAG: tetratricopeptide repeat protein [Lysobacter sp.]|nr:tetratricopeptide repeat protein [Lysobacter sp.]